MKKTFAANSQATTISYKNYDKPDPASNKSIFTPIWNDIRTGACDRRDAARAPHTTTNEHD